MFPRLSRDDWIMPAGLPSMDVRRHANSRGVAANGGDRNLVEVTPSGQQFATKLMDNTGIPPGPELSSDHSRNTEHSI